MSERFTGSFTQQEPIPEEGIAAAVAVMRHGRLHRYNTAPGEVAETVLLEQEFAALTGAKFCLAVASGGYALGCALRALGVQAGEAVLTNGFTLAPVPGGNCGDGGKAGLRRGDRGSGAGFRGSCGQGEGLRRSGADVVAYARACL